MRRGVWEESQEGKQAYAWFPFGLRTTSPPTVVCVLMGLTAPGRKIKQSSSQLPGACPLLMRFQLLQWVPGLAGAADTLLKRHSSLSLGKGTLFSKMRGQRGDYGRVTGSILEGVSLLKNNLDILIVTLHTISADRQMLIRKTGFCLPDFSM